MRNLRNFRFVSLVLNVNISLRHYVVCPVISSACLRNLIAAHRDYLPAVSHQGGTNLSGKVDGTKCGHFCQKGTKLIFCGAYACVAKECINEARRRFTNILFGIAANEYIRSVEYAGYLLTWIIFVVAFLPVDSD